jgi:photosystem II stability/assembly factor-like uncharacterized protein
LALVVLSLGVLVATALPVSAMPLGWTSVGPMGGRIYNITGSPHDPRVLYARSEGGTHRSTDGGTTWEVVKTIYDNPCITRAQIWVDPFDADTLYCSDIASFQRSTDGGMTWSWNEIPDEYESIYANFVFHPTQPGTFYLVGTIGTDSAPIRYTTDNGETFSVIQYNGADVYYGSLAFSPTPPHRLYLSLYEQLLVSDDGGTTWQTVNTEHGLSLLADDGTFYDFAVAEPNAPVGIYRSSDTGVTWVAANSGLPPYGAEVENYRVFGDPLTPSTLYYVRYNTDTAAIAFYRTTNAGNSWHPLTANFPLAPTRWGNMQFFMTPTTPSRLYVLETGLSDGTVYCTDTLGDTWTWERADTGLSTLILRDLQQDPTNPDALFAIGHPFYRTEDGGATWQTTPAFNDISELAIAPGDSTRHYASTGDGVLRSDDRGLTWTYFNNGLEMDDAALKRIAVSPTDEDVVVTVDDSESLYHTTTGGLTWTVAYTQALDNYVVDVEFAPSGSAPIAYAALTHGVLRSEDNGATWQEVAGTGLPTGSLSMLALHPTDTNTLFVGASNAASVLYKSVDGGATWTALPVGAPAMQTGFVLWFDPADSNTLLFATNRGSAYNGWVQDSGTLYRSADGGATWAADTTTMPYPAIMDIVGTSDNLYVNTAGGGVWHFGEVAPPMPTPTATTIPSPTLSPTTTPPTPTATPTGSPTRMIYLPMVRRS